MSRRLVWLRFDWLPFDAARLGRLPPDIEAEEYTGGPLPDSAGRVQLLVPPYDTALDVSPLLPRLPDLRVLRMQTAGVDTVEAWYRRT